MGINIYIKSTQKNKIFTNTVMPDTQKLCDSTFHDYKEDKNVGNGENCRGFESAHIKQWCGIVLG